MKSIHTSGLDAVLHAMQSGEARSHSTASSNIALHAITVTLPELAAATPVFKDFI